MSDTASSEMSRMHSLSVEQGKRIAGLEAEVADLQDARKMDRLVLKAENAKLEAKLEQFDATVDILNQTRAENCQHCNSSNTSTRHYTVDSPMGEVEKMRIECRECGEDTVRQVD